MANTLKIKRGTAATIPQGQLAEPLFTTDTYDLYIGKGAGGNQRIQNYIASGTSSQFLKGDGTLDSTSYQPLITAGTTLQYYRGDKTFQTLDTSVVPENGPIYFTEPRVRATVLTGLNLSGGGTIAATDSILTAFGKVQNQISALVGGATYQGTWNASTNTPTLASGTGTKGYYYVVSVAGSTNLDGITDWKIGDWAIFNGTTWDKVDNTDAVSSVNGFTGAVNLALDNISDVSAASPTNAQLLRFNGTSSLWENWTPTFEPALTKGNLTEATSSVLTITGGTGAVIGSGTTIAVAQASGSTSGYLSSTDWTTFNNKQAALTNPVTGTGTNNEIAYFNTTGSTISSLSTATYPSLTELSYVKGVTSAIQTQLNAKEPTVTKGNLTETTSSVLTITGGTAAVIGSGTTIAVASAGAAQAGVVTTGTQTFAGAKTFSSNVTSTAFIPTGATIPTVGMYSSASNFLDFSTNSTRAITIDAGQKVGIGADPISAYRLYVNGDILAAATVYGSMGSFVGTGTFGSTVTATAFIVTGSGVPSNGIYLSAANTLALSSGSSQRMILNSSGNIGINTNAPVGRLHVHHSSDTDSRIVVTNSTTGNGSVGAEKGFHVVEQGNNTYLFNYQNGPIIFGTNGTENGGFRLNAGGNVGLGNTNNAYKLEVTGTTKLDGTLLTTGAATFSGDVSIVNATAAIMTLQGASGNSKNIYFKSTGNADISVRLYQPGSTNNFVIATGDGTVAPTDRLTISSTGAATFSSSAAKVMEIQSSTATGGYVRYTYNGTTSIGYIGSSSQLSGLGAVSDLELRADNNLILTTTSGQLRITSGGNVGIGTASPSDKLTVTDASTYTFNIGAASGGAGAVLYTLGSAALTFATNGSANTRMTITSGGDVAINNSTAVSTSLVGALTIWKTYGADGASVPSPTAQNYYNNQDGLYLFGRNSGLSIISANGEEGAIHFANASTIAYATIGTTSGTSSVGGDMYFKVGSNVERMRITSGGNVIIGGTGSSGEGTLTLRKDGGTPATIANESASGNLILFSGNGSGTLGSITHNGSNVAYNTSSDYRLKQDFKDFNGLDLVNKIKVYDYEWKSNSTRSYGVIAHELQEILGYAVVGEKDGVNMQGVDYSKLTPILVKAIQEQQAQIEELKSKLN